MLLTPPGASPKPRTKASAAPRPIGFGCRGGSWLCHVWRPCWAHMIRFWVCTAANPGRHRLQAAALLKHNHPCSCPAVAEAGREPHPSSCPQECEVTRPRPTAAPQRHRGGALAVFALPSGGGAERVGEFVIIKAGWSPIKKSCLCLIQSAVQTRASGTRPGAAGGPRTAPSLRA